MVRRICKPPPKTCHNAARGSHSGCRHRVCCVGNDDDLRSVTLGADGAFAGMQPGAIFVDHTTASAEVARELYAAAKAWACSLSMPPSPAARPVHKTAC
jgi:3-hydroxyisobutyrate dehydrogenase-like beta-hydroxyacid dehydrogenase